MTVTQKMIFIDNWVKEGMSESGYEKIFKYLNDIIISIACKKGWFAGYELVDFANELSTNIFMRMIEPENSMVYKPKKEKKKITQIKNLLSTVMLGAAIKYREKYYRKTPKNSDKYDLTETDIKKQVFQYNPIFSWESSELSIMFRDTVESLPKLIRDYIKRNNMGFNSELLYVNLQLNLIKVLSDLKLNQEIEIKKIILYGLPKSERDKITLLVRGLLRTIMKEFQDLLSDSELTLEEFYKASLSEYRGEQHETEED